MLPIGQRLVRAVTHLDVDGDDVRRAGAIIEAVTAALRASAKATR